MPTSRAVVVLGMHRSGTSAVARGLAALGVYLGDDFLDAQPENPTGYWEDRHVVALDDRVLKGFGLRWDSVERIARAEFARGRFRKLRREAGRYCERTFTAHAVWGFKDPRVVRVLPFWQRVLRDCDAQDCYVIAIRNPRSVAASLFARQAMPADDAYRLWLANVVPFLGDAFDRPFVVVDYDVLMRDARVQLERIAQALGLPADSGEVERFAAEFLDAGLRHASFEPGDLEQTTPAARLAAQAYLLLYESAAERDGSSAASLMSRWTQIAATVDELLPLNAPLRGWFRY